MPEFPFVFRGETLDEEEANAAAVATEQPDLAANCRR